MNLMLLPLLAGAWTKLAQLVVDHQMESDDGMRKFTRHTKTCSQLRNRHQKVFQLRLPHNVTYNTLKTVEKTTDCSASTAPATENGTTRSAL